MSVRLFLFFFPHLCCALPAPTGSAPGPWSRPPSAPGCLPEACTCPGFSSFGTRSQSTSRCRRCFGSGQYLKSKNIKKKTWFSFKFDLSVVAQYVLQAPLNWWTEGDKRSLCHVNNQMLPLSDERSELWRWTFWETHESVHCNTVAQFKLVTTKMQAVFPGSPNDVSVGVCTLKDCL